MRPSVRCLVWDLDDAMWLGDTRLPSATAVRTLHALDHLGVLHAATGRRDHIQALARHGLTDMFTVLEFGEGAAPVRLAASTVDVSLTEVAVLTDDPAVRAELSATLPGVRCFPVSMVERLPDLADFTPTVITSETRDRRRIFHAERHRRSAAAGHPGTSASFVASLDLELAVRHARPSDLLTADRFTATGRVLAPAELHALSTSPGHEVLAATLRDRFGPYGMVGLAVLAAGECSTTVDLMMCDRVLSRGAGTAFVDHLVNRTLSTGRFPVTEFVPTPANRQLLVALRFSGFEVTARSDGHLTLTFDPASPTRHHHPVRVVTG